MNNADASVVTDTDGHIADGSIKLGQDANVVVTNTPKNQGQEQDQTFIRISKTFEGLTDTEIGELANAEPPYKITVTGKKLDTPGKLRDVEQVRITLQRTITTKTDIPQK